MAKSLMIQGTGSGVGKSVLTAAFCRIFLQDGFNVCPFKAQNMSLNSFVTKEGGEMGRAQVVQAQASKLEPRVEMNPVLIKPSSDVMAQVIVSGKPIGNLNALKYTNYKQKLRKTVRESFQKLAKEFEVIVLEGAGSPAEVNLRKNDLVNMSMAFFAKAPVILVADIDKGGALAWVCGTLDLLTKKERQMVKGIIINKFRGDIALLKPGLKFLEKRTGVKVLGVVPFFRGIKIPEEDGVYCDDLKNKQLAKKKINVSVIYLPHISNFTDFDCLEKEPDVDLRYLRLPEELVNPDIIILPGTKNTISDLNWLRRSGFAQAILSSLDLRPSAILTGICGGYQMLGKKIFDRGQAESSQKEIDGLGLLDIQTYLKKDKILAQVKAKERTSGKSVSGYEIHHGQTKSALGPWFEVSQGKKSYFDGAISSDRRIFGTYIHGIFDNDEFRNNFLNRARKNKGAPELAVRKGLNLEQEYDKLATVVRNNLDMRSIYRILGVKR